MTNTPEHYVHIGFDLSLYSGKTRSYFIHKRIPFVERGTSPWEFWLTLPRKVGVTAFPTVITPQGDYLLDTSVIIDTLERRFPGQPALPASPILRMASYLFELWGDEFWLPLAMHTRWSHREENVGLFIHDVGEAVMAGFPRWMRDKVGFHYANAMNSYLPPLGVSPKTQALLNRFLKTHLDGLDAHFSRHAFLFGNRPSLGDYGMIAPLYAHIGRDPWSKRELIAPRVHLKAWIERMFDAESSTAGEFQVHDNLPETLQPALRSIMDEMLPFVRGCAEALRRTPVLPATTRKAPRFLNETLRFPFAGGTYERSALAYPVWMAQRMMDAFATMTVHDQQIVREWLVSIDGSGWLDLDLPRVQRIGLTAARIA